MRQKSDEGMDGNAGNAAPGSVAEYMKLVTAGKVVPARVDEYITELVDAGLYETIVDGNARILRISATWHV